MNPHEDHSSSPRFLASSLWKHRVLIVRLTKRDVVGRYKGSLLGLGWSLVHPIFMLSVYTFVFSVVFKARWGESTDESRAQFAVVLFVGLLIHSLFAEVANRSPALIQQNANYVKRVVFPLEILPVVTMGATLFHTLISLGVLLVAFLVIHGFVFWTAIFVPVVLFPLVLLTLGISWFLASIGLYLRDIGQLVVIITTIMLFLSPVFYSASALPQEYQNLLLLNPLTFIIEQSRQVLIHGALPNWAALAVYCGVGTLISWAGFWWFQKTRDGFPDVL